MTSSRADASIREDAFDDNPAPAAAARQVRRIDAHESDLESDAANEQTAKRTGKKASPDKAVAKKTTPATRKTATRKTTKEKKKTLDDEEEEEEEEDGVVEGEDASDSQLVKIDYNNRRRRVQKTLPMLERVSFKAQQMFASAIYKTTDEMREKIDVLNENVQILCNLQRQANELNFRGHPDYTQLPAPIIKQIEAGREVKSLNRILGLANINIHQETAVNSPMQRSASSSTSSLLNKRNSSALESGSASSSKRRASDGSNQMAEGQENEVS